MTPLSPLDGIVQAFKMLDEQAIRAPSIGKH